MDIKIKYVSLITKSRNSNYQNFEIAVSRHTLRCLCEHFSVQFCDYVHMHICDVKDNEREFEYNVDDNNRDMVYFTVIEKIANLYAFFGG